MEITRRSLLGATVVAGTGLLTPLRLADAANAAKPAPSVLTPFTEQLPTLLDRPGVRGLGIIDATSGNPKAIEMANATHSFHAGFTSGTPTFAYKGGDLGTTSQSLLGPVIVAHKDMAFDLTVTNHLGAHPLSDAIDTGIMGASDSDRTTPHAAVHLHGGNTSPENDGDPLRVRVG